MVDPGSKSSDKKCGNLGPGKQKGAEDGKQNAEATVNSKKHGEDKVWVILAKKVSMVSGIKEAVKVGIGTLDSRDGVKTYKDSGKAFGLRKYFAMAHC